MTSGVQRAPRTRSSCFQWSRRSLMSSLTRASRPMLRILAVVLMASRGLLPQRALAPDQALKLLALFHLLG